MDKDFEKFMSQLKVTNQTLDFFCDYGKIKQNVDNIKLSLNMLNSLIGSENLQKSVATIWNRDKTAFEVLPILIAVRDGTSSVLHHGMVKTLDGVCSSVDGVVDFLENTGLADLFEKSTISNLVDYVFGVETGLDTNARKNRSGHIMEDTVADIFTQEGIPYQTEIYSCQWPNITKVLGSDKKRFDFVVESAGITYLIEVNFYSGGGSKLNEVARSYSDIAPKINSVDGFEFVWITDGIGWKSAKNKLEEAYNIIPKVYNLTSIVEFINLIK